MRSIQLPSGATLPVLGLGTWGLGERASSRSAEVKAVRSAIDMGYRLIDTAEMYGEGAAEQVVGQAVAEALRDGAVRRDELFIVSKVYPHNASRAGTVAACDRSRKRLGLDRIDLYLLHWRGQHPLVQTVEAMRALLCRGDIKHWGVSNFDVDDMEDVLAAQGRQQGVRCETDQVYHSLTQRGCEHSLAPWLQARGMPLMAYSPIDRGALAADTVLQDIGRRRDVSAARVALAWLLSRPGVVAIPKAVQIKHLQDNLAAVDLVLTPQELEEIDAHHPAPSSKTPLAML
ncbi:MAG: aldo/keto reductase [Rhizobacter sp.]|nr:aldo/keto reductase [Rhizobacter sp.]